LKCDECLNHAKWENDKEETGCFCFKGYDLAHNLNCQEKTPVQCEELLKTK